MPTENEKMLAGELYDPLDPALRLIHLELEQLPEKLRFARKVLVNGLLAHPQVMSHLVHCDFGET
jgi:hypothetical protein